MQRIGLSATQRPLEEVAHFLGGASTATEPFVADPLQAAAGTVDQDSPVVAYRPVTIVDASEPKKLDLRIEVPVEDMARMGQREELPSGAASQGPNGLPSGPPFIRVCSRSFASAIPPSSS